VTRTFFRSCGLSFSVDSPVEIRDPLGELVCPFRCEPIDRVCHHIEFRFRRGRAFRGVNPVNLLDCSSRSTVVEVFSGHIKAVSAGLGLGLVHALAASKGLVLHAGGLLLDGRLQTFAGCSGAGKSTLLANAGAGLEVHDDRVGLRFQQGCWLAYGLPLMTNDGRTGIVCKAPLGRVFILSKGKRLARVQLNTLLAISELAPHVITPTWHADLAVCALDTLMALSGSARIERLRFGLHSDVTWIVSRGAA
jgi:hypothetical protein